MTRQKRQERRLIIVSKRREPTDAGLARLVAAMVLHRIEQQNDDTAPSTPPPGNLRGAS